MPRTRRTPQQKKDLSYDRDRRNTYGENNKGSRKILPRIKADLIRAHRKAVSQSLAPAVGPVGDAEVLEMLEAVVTGLRRKMFEQFPGTPLRVVVADMIHLRIERDGPRD